MVPSQAYDAHRSYTFDVAVLACLWACTAVQLCTAKDG